MVYMVVVVFGLENCEKGVLDLYANRYHRPLSDITAISGTRSYAHILKPIFPQL
jgi:hypothetical protein